MTWQAISARPYIKVIRKKDLIFKNMTGQAMAERDALITTDNPFIVKVLNPSTSTAHRINVTLASHQCDRHILPSTWDLPSYQREPTTPST